MQGYQRLAFWRAAGPLLARPRPPRAPSKFEALPRSPRLHLSDQRLDLSAEQVQVNISGEGATGGAGPWHPLRLDAELEVKLDELALHAKSSTWTPLPLGCRFRPLRGGGSALRAGWRKYLPGSWPYSRQPRPERAVAGCMNEGTVCGGQ